MGEKNLQHTGFFGPVKLEDLERTDMYLNYLASRKKGDRLLFTFPNLPIAASKNSQNIFLNNTIKLS